jgi:hypothetical protein
MTLGNLKLLFTSVLIYCYVMKLSKDLILWGNALHMPYILSCEVVVHH